MERQLRMGGGIMDVAPRQDFFLGKIAKAVGKGVKGVTKGIGSFLKSDAGKLALLATAGYGLGGGTFFGKSLPFLKAGGGFSMGNLGTNIGGLLKLKGGKENLLGDMLKVGGTTGILAGVLAGEEGEGESKPIAGRDIPSLKAKLTKAYELQRTFKDSPNEAAAIAAQVENDVNEYVSGAGGYAEGGRIGFEDGTSKSLLDLLDMTAKERKRMEMKQLADEVSKYVNIQGEGSKSGKRQISGAPEGFTIDSETYNALVKADIPLSQKIDLLASFEYGKGRDRIEKDNQEIFLGEGNYKKRDVGFGFNKDGEGFGGTVMYNMETGEPEFKGTFKKSFAEGGRLGYAFGDSAEDNAIQASGVMGLPLNTNPAGITELDLRETGGFIPPVGVKEKADDIPAMLSNNEFVFTADAVRGMGDGDVNKGAQRLYDQMKMLEKGGRV